MNDRLLSLVMALVVLCFGSFALAQSDTVKPRVGKYTLDAGYAGDKGVIQGVVRNSSGEILPNASVLIDETDIWILTDEQGQYWTEVPKGVYTLRVTHTGYESVIRKDLQIDANVGLEISVNMRPSAVKGLNIAAPDVEEMTILGTFNTMGSTTEIERTSNAIVDAVDADQLTRYGDSDIAGALKRVAGVSVNDGKYAVVRGLDGRYISSTLNGNLMPTTDPLRRDVQLDLFPANILGTLEIQKSFTANMPGDTTGGSIGMETKGLPDEWLMTVSGSLGFNTAVMGDDVIGYEGSSTDWLTFDDGERDLPSDVNSAYYAVQGPSSAPVSTCNVSGCSLSFEQSAELAQHFPVNYEITTESASPNFGLSYAIGNRYETSLGGVGFYGSAYLDNETSIRTGAEINDENKQATYERSAFKSSLGGYFVVGLEDNKDGEWLSKTIWLRQAEDVTRLETGYNVDEENEFESGSLSWNEREFFAQQFSGKHYFFDMQELEWRFGVSQTHMDEPDRRSWNYVGGTFLPSATERRFGSLVEDGTDFGFNYLLPITITSSISTDFKAGYLFNSRDRSWDLARFSFRRGQGGYPADLRLSPNVQLSLQNLADQRYQLRKTTTDTDSYKAAVETSAIYLHTETLINDSLSISAGVRSEDNIQELDYIYAGSTNVLDESHVLPVMAINYAPDDSWQFRGSFSQTISRPGVIERSESTMYDPDTDEQIIGNPELVTAEIENIDFRVEYYFSEGGSISAAWFAKTITNPIERTVADGSGSASQGAYTYRNAEGADLTGFEFDYNKAVLELDEWVVDVSGNLSFIQSEVTLDEDSLRLEGDDSIGRELQGQSPMLANIQFGFEHLDSGQQANLLLNWFDDKIYKIGRGTAFGNRIELGRATLDFNYKKIFENESEIKVKITNILDEKVEYSQGDTVIESYGEGTKVSVGYSHNF